VEIQNPELIKNTVELKGFTALDSSRNPASYSIGYKQPIRNQTDIESDWLQAS
jgi:hypothetical protein